MPGPKRFRPDVPTMQSVFIGAQNGNTRVLYDEAEAIAYLEGDPTHRQVFVGTLSVGAEMVIEMPKPKLVSLNSDATSKPE